MLIVWFLIVLLVAFVVGYKMASNKKRTVKLFVSAGMVGFGIGLIGMYPLLFVALIFIVVGLCIHSKAK